MSRPPLTLLPLLGALLGSLPPGTAAAAPVSDLKDPFRPVPADSRTGESVRSDGLRDPFVRDPAPREPASEPPASDLRDPWTRAADPDAAPTTASGDLRDPWAAAPGEPAPAAALPPVVQRPAGAPDRGLKDPWSGRRESASDLRNPWASGSARQPAAHRTSDLRDPFAPPVQRPRRARRAR